MLSTLWAKQTHVGVHCVALRCDAEEQVSACCNFDGIQNTEGVLIHCKVLNKITKLNSPLTIYTNKFSFGDDQLILV